MDHLRAIALTYPAAVSDRQVADIPRIVDHLAILFEAVKPPATICDLGGGIGLFSIGCTFLGYRAVVVDDFSDPINAELGDHALRPLRNAGVRVVTRDFVRNGLGPEVGEVDAFTTFESLEHWHDSPKALLRDVAATLPDKGVLIIGTPNSVNLRKRLTTALGRTHWSSMDDWYEQPIFRGHVREPRMADLEYIIADVGLTLERKVGRNWLGYVSPHRMSRLLTPYLDRLLRPMPTLCADIYVVGRKHCATAEHGREPTSH
ncbi:MAG: hypothetical protein QOI61_2469 [Actinomycetota bacterium]